MQQADEKILFTLPEAVKLTGVSRSVLYREINRGKLKASKIGVRTYLSRSSIEEWASELDNYQQPEKQEASHA